MQIACILVELCHFEVTLGLLVWLNSGTRNSTPGPFGDRSSVFIKNCIFMTAHPWWFQASTQNSPGLRWWPCIQLRGSFGCYMATKGNFWQKTETLMYFLNRSSVFIKNCIFMTAQTWWFQASTQNGPGPRWTSIWLYNGIREIIIGVKIMHFSIKTDQPVRSYAHLKRESLRIALHRSAILQELLHRTSYPLPSSQELIFTSIWLHNGIRETIGVKIMPFSINMDKPVRSYAY